MMRRAPVLMAVAMWLNAVAICSAQVGDAAAPAAAPAATASTGTTIAGFCSKGQTREVVAFCPALTDLMNGVAALKAASVPSDKWKSRLRPTLNQLNPASRVALKHMSAILRLRELPEMGKQDISGLVQSAGQVRTDRQLGASTSASGTTSLVTKAGSAELLSLALDAGALTRSIDGSTATLSANADQLFRLVTGYNPDCLINCGKNGSGVGGFEGHVLNPLTFAASFALTQTSTTATPTAGQASGTSTVSEASVAIPSGVGKLTGISAKYQIVNKFDPRSKSFKNAWQGQIAALTPAAKQVESDTEKIDITLQKEPAMLAGRTSDTFQQPLIDAATNDPSGKKLIAAFEDLWRQEHAEDALGDPDLVAATGSLVQDRQLYRDAWAKAIANSAGVLLSVQYGFNKPASQPQTHDITLVSGYSFGTYGSLTANGAVSLYNGTLPVGAKYGRVHYGQFSAEYDRNLVNPLKSFQSQLSLAGYWQYQPEPSVLNIPAGTVAPGTDIPLPNGTQEFVGTAGSLFVTQAKLTIKGAGGINIPLGVSWSNKTDLLQGNKVGGQIGISYNFSTLAGLFSK